MFGDWLFQWPADRRWRACCEALEAEVAKHPDVQAIPDDEAEQFAAVAYGLLHAHPSVITQLCRSLDLRPPLNTERSVRGATLSMLRSWSGRKHREFLVHLPEFLGIPPLPELVGRGASRISGQMLIDAWSDGTALCWILQIMRRLNEHDEIPHLMEVLGEDGAIERRIWIAQGKLMIRRIVWQGQAQAEARAAEQAQRQQSLKRRFQAQETLLKSLASDMAAVAQRRDALRQAARESEANVGALLAQARAEVAVAAAELEGRRAAQARERADQDARLEARVQEAARRLAALRSEQAAALRERGRSGVGPLAGLTFAVTGAGADADGCRALIESAGGRVLKEGAAVVIQLGAGADAGFATTGTGLAALERVIRHEVLPQLQQLRAGGPSVQNMSRNG